MPVIVPVTTYYSNILPSDWIAPIEEALDKIGLDIEAARVSWTPEGILLRHILHILENARMDFPLIPGSVLEFEPNDEHPGIELEIRIKDTVVIELKNIGLRLAFSPDFLKGYILNPEPRPIPNDPDYLTYIPATPPQTPQQDENEPTEETVSDEPPGVGFAVGVNFPLLGADFYGNINVDPPNELNFLPYAAMIGDTGVILDFNEPGSTNNAIEFILSDSNLTYSEILASEEEAEEEDTDENDADGSDSEEETGANGISEIESVSDLPPGFRGVRINRLRIFYQKQGANFPPITFRNAAIGNGGFWGEVYLGTPPPTQGPDIRPSKRDLDDLFNQENGTPEHRQDNLPSTIHEEDANGTHSSVTHPVYPINIAGMKAAFQYFGIGFRQSIPEWGSLRGFIFTPLINKWVSLRASIGGPNGDFMLEIGGVGNEGLVNLETDIFKITADSIAYQLKEGVNYAVVSGSIRLKVPPDMNMPEFRAQKISISEKGDVAIEGGWVRAPQQVTLDLGGFKIGIREFGMGTDGDTPETKRQWIGFSGSVQLTEGIPIKGSVEGLKISWATDENLKNFKLAHPGENEINTVNVSLRGIGVELIAKSIERRVPTVGDVIPS